MSTLQLYFSSAGSWWFRGGDPGVPLLNPFYRIHWRNLLSINHQLCNRIAFYLTVHVRQLDWGSTTDCLSPRDLKLPKGAASAWFPKTWDKGWPSRERTITTTLKSLKTHRIQMRFNPTSPLSSQWKRQQGQKVWFEPISILIKCYQEVVSQHYSDILL